VLFGRFVVAKLGGKRRDASYEVIGNFVAILEMETGTPFSFFPLG
jgi:hypothetical protein